ncbi:hypothetical protein MPK74_gp155 [Erwinia phage pEa_SNUABM_7]|uniref:Uncharacterized protein n=1 Tax=Erwinia phage pEa_SNUABM_7 TaxID=2866695 RepID=A0AAE7WUH2_9CAUD|nr:hypothetical protein MPK74_gp155 [Erwinia phage pEa_SNUABM_7]QYW04823.1 hypothetical protein pEaSNUABM7_00155 [Erwinia phage pEa_SNUABM_7]
MLSLPCTFDYWRNYKPIAPNRTIRVKNSGKTEITIDQILQGARDELTGHSPTEGVLDKVPAQRGWRLAAIKVSDPLLGTVELNSFSDAFIYDPRSGYVGGDCFSYILTNGTQQSDAGSITLDVYQWYAFKILLYRLNTEKTYHRMTATLVSSAGLKPVKFYEINWFYNQYRTVVDDKGVTRIYKRRLIQQSTVADYTAYNNRTVYAPTVINQGTEIRMSTYFDDTLGQGFNGDLNVPFVPKYSQGDMELEIRVYTEEKTVYSAALGRDILQVDLDQPIVLDYRLSEIYGKKWWDSGNVLV